MTHPDQGLTLTFVATTPIDRLAESAIVLLAMPGTPQGPTQTPCMSCKRKYPISMRSLLAVHGMRQQKTTHLVICWTCFQPLRGLLNPASPLVTARQARILLGLD